MGVVTRLRPHHGEPAPDELPRTGQGRAPWFWRRRVHLVLGIVVAVATMIWAGERAASGVRDTLDSRLRGAGAGADAAIVGIEAEQLAALRAVSFTQGVGQALATDDVPTLNKLVTPVQANSGVPMVDVVLPNGKVLLAVRSKGAPAPVASRAGLPALARSLKRAHGARGGRFSELVIFRSGPTFLTIGPVLDDNKPVGSVLVMTPLADVLGRVSQEVGTLLSAYDGSGNPIATTAGYVPRSIDRTTAHTLLGGGPVVMRYVHGDDREALGRLIVDHQPDAILGTALHDPSWVTGRAVLLIAGLGLLATIVAVSSYSIRLARRWWH
jgi:hypothetical protein